MKAVRALRARVSDLLGDAAFELPVFHAMYRRIRVAVAISIISFSLTIGVAWLERRAVVLSTLVALALVIIAHSWLSDTSWARMAVIDTVLYTAMLVLAEMSELIGMVVMSQLLIGVLFVSARMALRLAVVILSIGWIGYAVADLVAYQSYTRGQKLTLIVLITMMSVIPALWALLEASHEIRRESERADQLSAEKDELLVAKDRFVASVSHELRTPLTAVVGLAQLLSDAGEELGEAERHELTTLVARESEEVAAIVNDLLVIARIQGGSLSVSPEPVDLAELVYEVAASQRADAAALRVNPAVASADPMRVRQIVRNLITNAHRYGGPSLEVRTYSGDGEVSLQVRDDGDGVPPGRLEAIFDPYGRAHDRPGRTDSVGLGLTVSRQLAQLMGGDVIYRREGIWTVFELTLPAATGHAATPSEREPAPASITGSQPAAS